MLAEIVLAVTALLGHAVLWVGLNNRLHAVRLKRSHLKAISALVHFGTVAVPLAIAWWLYREQSQPGDWQAVFERNPIALFYALFCIGMALVHVPRWIYVRFIGLRNAKRIGQCIKVLDIAERLGKWPTRGWKFAVGRRIPGNQVMQVELVEKRVPLPNLPAELDGLRVLHLSDLHLSGRVESSFFIEVIQEINALEPDLILLSGDVFDTAECIPWIEAVLSPAQAKYGKFFVLGNHDDRLLDTQSARNAVAATGFVDLGGRSATLTIGSQTVFLVGNELPWFRSSLSDEDLLRCQSAQPPLKILLSHSPDQIRWARKHGFDLMLCGHTHGGQIQFPIVGPVVCPSWYGVRYAEGLFLERPTAMHVSRGVSGLFPLRINSRPAVDLLILRKKTL